MTASIEERVQRGADLLDEKRPGWWQEIDLGRLDIDSKCGCVLGQLGNARWNQSPTNPGFAMGLEVAGLRRSQSSAYGFDAEFTCLDFDAEYAGLTAAWRDLITARREMAGVPA